MITKKKGKLLNTKTPGLSAGQQMLYDKEVSDEIKKRYKDDELTEMMERILPDDD